MGSDPEIRKLVEALESENEQLRGKVVHMGDLLNSTRHATGAYLANSQNLVKPGSLSRDAFRRASAGIVERRR
jgi:hypothetical protein